MDNSTLKPEKKESTLAKPDAQELEQVWQEINSALSAYHQFGEVNPRLPGMKSDAAQVAKKWMRRSLAWYTRPNHDFQGAVINALQHLAKVAERHDSALRQYAADGENDLSASPRSASKMSGELSDTATASDLLYCFRLLLGREPTHQEWLGHSYHVGEELAPVVSSYLNSQEFAARHLLDRRLQGWELVDLPHCKMYVSSEDTFLGKTILQTHEYEPHVGRIFREYLRPGMHVLDVGANIGYFSLLAASLVGSNGIVYSWEPSSKNVKALLASQLANNFRNIEIMQAAATQATTLLKYFPNLSNGNVAELDETEPGDILSVETVMGLRIDDIIPPDIQIGLVKIDVEGHEFKAMRGALKTLERSKPIIVSEFSPLSLQRYSDVSGPAYLEFFVDLGYDLLVITDAATIPGNIGDVMSHFEQRGSDHIDILLRPKTYRAR